MGGTFRDALQSAAKGAVCQALQASSDFGSALVYAWQQVTGISAYPPDLAGIAHGLLCDAPSSPIGGDASQPYGGANCVCDRYRLTYNLNRRTGTPLTGSEVFYGPISAIYLAGKSNPAYTRIDIVCRGKVGTDSGCLPSDVVRSSGAGTSAADVESFTIISCVNESNPGSNCGLNPVVNPTPLPDTGIHLPDIHFEFSPTTQVGSPVVQTTVNIVIFQPTLNVHGEIIVPMNLEVDLKLGSANFNVNADVNINTGDISFQFGGGGESTGGGGSASRPVSPCGDNLEPVGDLPIPDNSVPGQPNNPDIKESTILEGVIVTVKSVSLTNRATLIAQGENPSIYAPNLGYVNFFYKVGSGGAYAWGSDIPVKNFRQFIPADYVDGAASVSGTPRQGVVWELTPVKRTIQSQVYKK